MTTPRSAGARTVGGNEPAAIAAAKRKLAHSFVCGTARGSMTQIQGGNEQMRKLALSVAAILVLAVVSPAFAQPFADVPTDHWAFDAIAELAAKGIIEGFPDGTFKGDRGVTRYEVAMIVARILARIEAIKIPAPAAPAPAPQVTRADVQTIQRLVNEFRAELAALGVRVTAVEEELTALKGALDKTKVTGSTRLRYSQGGTGTSSANLRTRLQFTSAPGGPITVVTRLGYQSAAGGGLTFVDPVSATGAPALFDLAYFDWSAGFFGTSWRVGQQTFVLGANGLLLDTTNSTNAVSLGGAKVSGSFGPVSLTAVAFAATAAVNNVWALSAGVNLLPGWTTNFHYYTQRPVGAAESSGYGADLSGSFFPGVSFTFDYASYTPAAGTAQTAWRADADIDLSSMGMSAMSPTLKVFYKDYGTAAGGGPAYSSSDFEFVGGFTWAMRSWGTVIGLTLNPTWSAELTYESGTAKLTGSAVTEYNAKLRYALGGGATADLIYRTQTIAGATTAGYPLYRIEFNYSW